MGRQPDSHQTPARPGWLRRMVQAPARWRWPLPAVLAWGACWVLLRGLSAQGVALHWALGAACALGVVCSLWGATWWRRLWIALGFPLSLGLSASALGAQHLPAWAWLLPLGVLLLVYPLNAWRDAPLFPTPPDALQDLPSHAPLGLQARILDAGCGLGHGLIALRRAYAQAQLHGLEWSWPLRGLCALRCPWAQVRQGDMWRASWADYHMVYLFQRPESMERAWAKARAELPAGAWLVSLDFPIPSVPPTAQWPSPQGTQVWLYQMPHPGADQKAQHATLA